MGRSMGKDTLFGLIRVYMLAISMITISMEKVKTIHRRHVLVVRWTDIQRRLEK